jgi:peptidoglycan/LPS O-acetylase OafA/YrhL
VPALIVTLVATLLLGWCLYLPDDCEMLTSAVMAQTAVASNIFHWRTAGYFGPETEQLPLLHTWSLAVEEQFYILLPVGLVVIAALRRSWIRPAIGIACCA